MPGQPAGEDRHVVGIPPAAAAAQGYEVRGGEPGSRREHGLRVQAAEDLDVLVLVPREPAGDVLLEQRAGQRAVEADVEIEHGQRQPGNERHPLDERAHVPAVRHEQAAAALDAVAARRVLDAGHGLGLHPAVLGPILRRLPGGADRRRGTRRPRRELLREPVAAVGGPAQRQQAAGPRMGLEANQAVVENQLGARIAA